MQIGTKIGLIGAGILLVFGLIVFGSIAAFTLYTMKTGTDRARELYKKRTAETEGTITNVRDGTGRNVIYTYRYSVNGTAHSGEYFGTRTPGDNRHLARVGKRGHVCYEPGDPASSEFYSYEYSPRVEDGGKPVCAKPAP